MKIESLEQRLVLAGDIAGVVFHDLNGDGVQDVGDVGIAGATVFLDSNLNGALDGGELSTTTADGTGAAALGSYQFTGLAAGDYTVAQVLPTGWLQTAANSPGVGRVGEVTHSIASAGTGRPVSAAWVNGTIFQVEWIDTSTPSKVWQVDPTTGQATFAFNSPGPVGFIAFDGANLWGTDFTNDKIYRFDTSGTLLNAFDAPGTSPDGIAWDGVNLWVADRNADAIDKLDVSNLSLSQLPVLSTIAAPDGNARGLTFDGQHLWMSGIDADRLYQIDRDSGAVVQSFAPPLSSTASSPMGVAFDGHLLWYTDYAGNRLVQVDPGGDHRDVTVVDAAVSVAAPIGNVQLATIGGTVFYDGDESGTQDAGEIGLEGRNVFLDHDADGQIDAGEAVALTDADGNYQLSVRIGRDYTVAQVLPPVHWRQVSPTDPAHTVIVDTSGEVVTGVDFADILDRVDPLPTDWVPADGSMKNLYTGLSWFDGYLAEGALTNWSSANIYADTATVGGFDDWRMPSRDEAQQAALNGAGQSGFLAFGGVGYYWTSTKGSGNNYWTVQMSSGDAAQALKSNPRYFEIVRDTATTIDDGSAGYTNTSGWTNKSNSAANAGDYRQATAGTGSKTATWTFTGLEVGASYKIAASWFAASANASNSPFTIRDGGVSEGTVLVNQKVAANDFKVGNTWWEGLGTFTADSETFTVTLSNQANGTVVADAVRLFKVYDSYLGGSESLAASSGGEGLAALSFAVESESDGGGSGGERRSRSGGGRQADRPASGSDFDDPALTLVASSAGGGGGSGLSGTGGSLAAHDAVFGQPNDFLLDGLLPDLAG